MQTLVTKAVEVILTLHSDHYNCFFPKTCIRGDEHVNHRLSIQLLPRTQDQNFIICSWKVPFFTISTCGLFFYGGLESVAEPGILHRGAQYYNVTQIQR